MFNKRAIQILNILLAKESAITGTKLAEQLQVSDRTIRSDIAQINKQLKSEEIEVMACNPYGYFIEESDKTLLRMIMEESDERDESYYIPNTPSDRVNFIALKLISGQDYISMNDLADELFVSKATINQGVKRLIQIMKEKGNIVQLQSSTMGIRMIGDELEQRILVSNLLNKQDKSINFLVKLLRFIETKNKSSRVQIMELYHAIIQQIETHGMFLTDREVHGLVIYIVITMKRIKLGYELSDEKDNKEVGELTLDIAQNASEIFHIGLCKAEVLAIKDRLDGRRIVNAVELEQTDVKINQVIESFLQRVNKIYGLNFSNHQNLRKFLYLHIKPMLHRLRRKENEENPLKDDIKKKFPLATEISFLLLQEVKDTFHLQMNDSEISYIALHIAAALEILSTPTRIMIVSNLGASSLQLMRTKISNHFTNKINIVGCYTVYQMNSMLSKQSLPACDLIISTSTLSMLHQYQVVVVSPLVVREDIANIKHYIHYYALELKDKNKFLRLFDEDLFIFVDKEYTYYEIIGKLVQMVYDKQIITDEKYYYDLVIQREEAYSTIMDNRIAIPHAAENIANKTVIATAVLRKPIEHNGKKISLILLNVTNVNEDLQTMYAAIEKMLEIESIEPLTKSDSFKKFIEQLK